MSGLLNFLIIDWVWTTPVTRGQKVATLAPWAKSVSLVTRQCLEDSSSHGVPGQKHRQEGIKGVTTAFPQSHDHQ